MVDCLGIIVSKNYQNLDLIKNKIYDSVRAVGKSNIGICQITDNAFYKTIKNFCIASDMQYCDMLRYDEDYNQYSAEVAPFKYGKQYSPRYFHIRNSKFINTCSGVYFFMNDIVEGEVAKTIYDKMMSLNKNIKVFA